LKDLTNLKTYIIDSDDPHEIDDAISLEIKEGNKSRFFIDILNFMIQREIKVFCNEFDGGWIELHTENDFELAEKELEN